MAKASRLLLCNAGYGQSCGASIASSQQRPIRAVCDGQGFLGDVATYHCLARKRYGRLSAPSVEGSVRTSLDTEGQKCKQKTAKNQPR